MDSLTLALYIVNGLIPFVFSALLYRRYSEKKKWFYLYWLIGFCAYGLANISNVVNLLLETPSSIISVFLALCSMLAFVNIATGVGELVNKAQVFLLVSLGAPAMLLALSVTGLYNFTLSLMLMIPYLIITGGLILLQIKYKGDLGLAGLGWFLILIANIGYSTGNISFIVTPIITIIGKSVFFYWMTRPRFSMITEEFEAFMKEPTTSVHGSIVTMVETTTRQQDRKWIRDQIIEGGSKGIRSILILTSDHVAEEVLNPELMKLPNLYIIKMVQERHQRGDAFSERVMTISMDVDELTLLLNDIRDFIAVHGVKSQIIIYNVSTLIFTAGWKRIYTFMISMLPKLKDKEILSYFIYSPEAHEHLHEVEIMRHLGDKVVKTG